jgi:hypothetical protein
LEWQRPSSMKWITALGADTSIPVNNTARGENMRAPISRLVLALLLACARSAPEKRAARESLDVAKAAASTEGLETKPPNPPDAAAYPPWCASAKSEYAAEMERLNFCRRDRDCFYFDSCNPINIAADHGGLLELSSALTSHRCGFPVDDCCRAAPRCVAKRCVGGGATDYGTCTRQEKAARRRMELLRK